VAGQAPQVPERAVAAVEQTGLDQRVRLDVVDELGAHGVERRAAVAEGVLDDPLRERLGHDRRAVEDPERPRDHGAVRVARARCDAVDHAARERTLALDPAGERRVAQPRARDHRPPRQLPVARHVVARQDRERRQAGATPARERLDEEAEGRRRPAGRGVRDDPVAVARDRQRDQARARIGQRRQHRAALLGREQVAAQRADDARAVAVRAARDHRVEPVLRGQVAAELRAVQPDSDQAPGAGHALLRELVEVHRLVRAVERADADVHDGRHQRRARVRRHGDARRVDAEGPGVERRPAHARRL
jgi:hypothetical protein